MEIWHHSANFFQVIIHFLVTDGLGEFVVIFLQYPLDHRVYRYGNRISGFYLGDLNEPIFDVLSPQVGKYTLSLHDALPI